MFNNWKMKTLIIGGIFVLVLMGLGTQSIKAWVVQNPKWDLSSSNIVYFRANELPTNFQNRLYNARDTWNSVSGASIVLSRNDSSYDLRVYDGNIDGTGGVIGQALRYWPWNTYISWATLKVDSSENWNDTTGGTAWNQVDLTGTLTHELGHTMAINHTNAGGCTGSSGPTMCPALDMGSDHMRSLMTDDENALRYLYP